MQGHTFKRCPCGTVRDANGRRINCPKRHGTWYYALELPRGADGKRRQVKIGGFPSEREARDALAEAKKMARTGTSIEHARQLVGEYLEQWLAGKVALRDTTRRSYRHAIDLYLAPGLGHLRLSDLTSLDVEALFAAMRDLGADADPARGSIAARLIAARKAPPRKPLSETTIRRVHAALRSALNSAVKRHLIAYNPALHVELPSARRPRAVVWTEDEVRAWQQGSDRPSVAVWTGEQLGAFLDAVSDDRLYPLFHLIAYRGLRRGEAVGLRWRDVDLDRGALRVSQQVVQLGWTTQTSDPKTDAGARTLPLDVNTIAVLKRWREQQQLDWQALDDAPLQPNLVFTREDGAGLHPGEVSARFRRLVKAAGLPPIRLHDLRHTSASLALAAGVPMKVVSDLLGHSTVTITADTYTSVLPEVAQEAANALAKIIPRTSAGDLATIDEAADAAAFDGLATTRFPIGSHSGPSGPSEAPPEKGEEDEHAGQEGCAVRDSNPEPAD